MSSSSIASENIRAGRHHRSMVSVIIDTVRAVTTSSVDEELIHDLKINDANKCYRRSGYELKPFDYPNKIWFHQYRDGTVVYELSFSYFPTVHDALKVLENELGEWALDAKLFRLDLAVTIPASFSDVFHGIDFGRKRSIMRWGRNSSGESFYIGKKNERRHKLIIYDKQKETRSRKKPYHRPLRYPCTRIEIDSIPKKGMTVRELDLVLEHCPFKEVRRTKVTLRRPTYRTGIRLDHYLKRMERYFTLKARYDDWGFKIAKEKLQKESNKNFHVLYKGLYEVEDISPSLDEIYQCGIKKFFKRPTKKGRNGEKKPSTRSN